MLTCVVTVGVQLRSGGGHRHRAKATRASTAIHDTHALASRDEAIL